MPVLRKSLQINLIDNLTQVILNDGFWKMFSSAYIFRILFKGKQPTSNGCVTWLVWRGRTNIITLCSLAYCVSERFIWLAWPSYSNSFWSDSETTVNLYVWMGKWMDGCIYACIHACICMWGVGNFSLILRSTTHYSTAYTIVPACCTLFQETW